MSARKSLLSYRDPEFWRDFHTHHWQPQVPTVLRQPFKVFPFSEELLFRSLTAFEAGLQDGDQRKHCLVSVGDKETAPRRPLRALFREKSESLEQLEQACAGVFPKKAFGLMITQMQAVDPGLWGALTAFLQDGREWLNLPLPRAFLDLFYGNYSSSFTGLHKDTQEIIAFVVRGEKRMLAWPFDYFLSKVKGLTPADKYFNKRLPIDHRKYRKDALVLEARAGDVIYWPSGYWHVSEVQGGRFSAMLSLGLLRPELRMTSAIQRPDAARQFRWRTGFGFELGGPLAEISRRNRDPISETVTVVRNKSCVILWKPMPHRRILVASNGHSITLPHSPKLIKLLEQISQGEAVTVFPVTRQVRREPYKIFETHWNKRCELKTHPRNSRGDFGAWLVDWMLRVYAVERAGASRGTIE